LAGHSVFSGLHLLRTLAAMSIVVIHAVARGAAEKTIPGGSDAVPWGLWLGVPVFFALSGFLMAKLLETATPGRFLLHRTLRIYPGYWLAVMLAGAITLFITGRPPAFDPIALTLVPAGAVALPLGPDWTLFFEMFFYALCAALCFVSARIRQGIVALWALAIIVSGPEPITTKIHQETLWSMPFSALNLSFIAGMGVYWLMPLARRLPFVAIALGAVAFVIWSPAVAAGSPNVWGYVLIPGALVLAFAFIPCPSPAVRFAADASYGLYLAHVPLLWLFHTLLPFGGWLQVGAIFACALAAGLAFGAVEHQAYVYLRGRLDGFLEVRRATV
jgi:peptidoglycan/LPS O-acetylase OafA/YrhL